MNWGVRAKLFAISVGLIGCAGLISAVFLEAKLRAWFEAELEAELIEKSYMVNETLQLVAMSNRKSINYDQLTDKMGLAAKARVTLIDDSGKVSLSYRPVHTYTLTDEVEYVEPRARVY